MDPISNQMFSYDFQRFVLQDIASQQLRPLTAPEKPFDIKKTEKSNKEMNKQKKQDKNDPKKLKKPFNF